MQFTLRSCLVLSLMQLCWSHPSGAPTSVCDHLIPSHNASPQKSSPPYKLVAHAVNASQVHLSIEGMDNSVFRGFAIQARRENASREALGRFVAMDSEQAHAINCFQQQENTITHSNRQDKPKVMAKWVVPNDLEADTKIVFVGTVLQNGKTFWTGVKSEPIKVGGYRAPDGNVVDTADHKKDIRGDAKSSSKIRNSCANKSLDSLVVSAVFLLFYLKI